MLNVQEAYPTLTKLLVDIVTFYAEGGLPGLSAALPEQGIDPDILTCTYKNTDSTTPARCAIGAILPDHLLENLTPEQLKEGVESLCTQKSEIGSFLKDTYWEKSLWSDWFDFVVLLSSIQLAHDNAASLARDANLTHKRFYINLVERLVDTESSDYFTVIARDLAHADMCSEHQKQLEHIIRTIPYTAPEEIADTTINKLLSGKPKNPYTYPG
jgi:hypothetical protein